MVAIVTGTGLGLERTSGLVIGARGQVGEAAQGRAGEQVTVNAANGNLIVQNTDEILTGVGLDDVISRTYNSLGSYPAGGWLESTQRSVTGLTGTLNTAGSTIKHTAWDGSDVIYTWDAGHSAYVANEEGGAYDNLTFNSGTNKWTWTEGKTQVVEVYDGANGGRIVSSTDASGAALAYGYTGALLTTVTTTDGSGHQDVTTLHYDGSSRLDYIQTTAFDLRSNTTQTLKRVAYTYDSSNRLWTVTYDLSPLDGSTADGKADTVTYAYNGTGQLASIAQTDGSLVQFGYTLVGSTYEVTQITQTAASGVTRVTGLAYDPVNHATTITDALGLQTKFEYNSAGQLKKITAPPAVSGGASQVTTFSYDAAGMGNLTGMVLPDSSVFAYGYDANGNRTSEVDGAGNTVTRTFGSRNELLTETRWLTPAQGGAAASGPVTTRYAYDAHDNLRYVVSAEGHVTEYRYSGSGLRQTAIQYTDVSRDLTGLTPTDTISESTLTSWASGTPDPTKSIRTDTSYDFRGNVSAVTAYAAVLSTGFGDNSQPVSQTTYIYDQAGRLIIRQPLGSSSSEVFAYDGLGRLISTTDFANQTTTVAFNDAASTTVVTLANGQTRTSTYDLAGELVTYSQSGLGDPVDTHYKYDADGRLMMVTDPTGLNTYHLYDNVGRKTADVLADGGLTEYVYNSDDLLIATIGYSNKLTAGQLTTLASAGATSPVAIGSIRPAATSDDRHVWRVYDAAQRLMQVIEDAGNDTGTRQGNVTAYAYDGASRLISTTAYANTVSVSAYVTTPPTGPASPTLSASDDRTSRNFYDADDRLVGTVDGAGYVSQIVYDMAGRKVQTIQYSNLPTVSTGTFANIVSHITADNANDIHNWFVYDGRGLLRGAIDGEGDLTRYDYDPLGYVSAETRGLKFDPAVLLATPPTLAAVTAAAGGTLDVTTYTHNQYGQVLTSTKALAGSVSELNTYTYDPATRLLTSQTTASGTTDARAATFQYDPLGRLVQELSGVGSAALAALGSTPAQAQIDNVYAVYGVHYTYDLAGRVISRTEPGGLDASNNPIRNTTLYYYDADGRVKYTINALGETVEYGYDTFGERSDVIAYGKRIASLTGMTGGYITAAVASAVAGLSDTAVGSLTAQSQTHTDYNTIGAIRDTIDPLTNQTSYTYNAFGQLKTRTDPLAGGSTTTAGFTYDQRGLVKTDAENQTPGAPITTTFYYDAFGRKIQTTDGLTHNRYLQYDRAGRVVVATDATGATTQYKYDSRGNLLQITDRTGAVTDYAYTEFERQLQVTTHLSATAGDTILTTTRQNAYGQTVSFTDGDGHQTTYAFDKDGRLATRTDALGIVQVSETYDGDGRLITSIDGNGAQTTYLYDAANRRTQAQVHLVGSNLTTGFTYDAKGQQTLVTDAAGTVTQIDYDLDGRVKRSVTDPSGLALATLYSYDPQGRLYTTTDAAGTITQYGYDAFERLIQTVVDPGSGHLNLTTAYTYDNAGNVVAKTDPTGAITRYVYDAENREAFCIDPAGGVKTFKYDGEGRRIKELDAATLYTASGTPTLSAMLDWYNGGNGQTSHADTVNDRITRWVYDGDGRLAFSIDPAGAVTSYKYDNAGRVVKQLRAVTFGTFGDGVSFSDMLTWYNGDSTHAAHADPADEIIRWVYDDAGRLAFSIDATGAVTSYKYDNDGRVVKQLRAATLGVFGDGVSYSDMLTWYNGDSTHAAHSSAADAVSRAVYDSAGRLAFGIDATGAVTSYKYDGAGRVVKQLRAVALGVFGDSVSYSDMLTWYNGDAAHPSHIDPADEIIRSVYDTAGRLAFSIDAAGAVTNYKYDAAGRVVKLLRAVTLGTFGDSVSYSDMLTWYNGDSTHAAHSDPNDQISRSVYDAAGRLAFSIDASGAVTSYKYDAAGDVVKVLRAATTDVFGDGVSYSDMLIWYNGDSTHAAHSSAADEISRAVYDAAGRLAFSIDAGGQVTIYNYDAYGRVVKLLRAVTPGSFGDSVSYSDMLTWYNGDSTHAAHSSTSDQISRTVYDVAGRVAFSIDAMGGVTSYKYDALGRLTKTLDCNTPASVGDGVTYQNMLDWYNGGNGQTAHGDAVNDRITRFVYDTDGRLAFSVDAVGAVTSYKYDAFGNVVKQLRAITPDSFGDGVGYTDMLVWYSGDSTHAAHSSASDAITRSFYDAANRAVFTVDPGGYVTNILYDNAGRVTCQTLYKDPYSVGDGVPTATFQTQFYATNPVLAARTTTTYDAMERVKTVKVALSSTADAITVNQYDAFGNLVKVTDPRGNAGLFYYDALNRLILQVDPEGYATATGYSVAADTVNQLAASYSFDSQAVTVTRYYNRATNLSAPFPTLSPSAQYDEVTTIRRDKQGRVTSITDAEQHTESYVLNAFGDRIQVKNKLGWTTYNSFDKQGRLTQEILPVASIRADGSTEAASVTNTYAYDTFGNLQSKTEASGLHDRRQTTYGYDHDNRSVSKTLDTFDTYDFNSVTSNRATPVEHYVYDALGNLIESDDALGARTLSYYDRNGRKSAELRQFDAPGMGISGHVGVLSTWDYDASGNVSSARVYEGLLALPTSPGGVRPTGGASYRETLYGYDLNKRLITTTIQGLTVGHIDQNGINPVVRDVVTYNTYDAAGNVVQTTDGEGNSVFTYYDKLGRRIAQVDQENYFTWWDLDQDGNVTAEQRFAGRLTLTASTTSDPVALKNNAAAQTANGQTVNGELDRVTTFNYDRNGRRLAEHRFNVGSYRVDSINGLVASSNTSDIYYTYNELGEVASKTEATGDSTTYTYDQMGRQSTATTSAFQVADGTTVHRVTQTLYDGLGNVTRVEVKRDNNAPAGEQRTTQYLYDTTGRLTSTLDASGFTRNYAYDLDGRLVRESYTRTKSDGTTVQEGTGYRYDAQGKVVFQTSLALINAAWDQGDDQTLYQYDAYGEMIHRGANGLVQESFAYDNAGRMWSSNSGDGVTKLYIYDAAGNLTLQVASSGRNLAGPSLWDATSGIINYLTGNNPTVNRIDNEHVVDVSPTEFVYDKRGQRIETRALYRELDANATPTTVHTYSSYNAFGEVWRDTDGYNNATLYQHDTLGDVVVKTLPAEYYTDQSGVRSTGKVSPIWTYRYDISGRLIATIDAEAHTVYRTLLAGTGYGGAAAVVLKEFHPDGTATNGVDLFGNITSITNEIGKVETRAYDGMDRLITVVHPLSGDGTHLTDHYVYDGLGQRTGHWNSQLGSAVVETTDYDRQGRVIRQVDFGAHAINYAYAWSTTASGVVAAIGGRVKTTTSYAGTSTETIDYFGRTVGHVDYSGHIYAYTYDVAGRLTSQSPQSGATTTWGYFNTGQVKTMTSTAQGFAGSTYDGFSYGHTLVTASAFSYDKNGSRVTETVSQTIDGGPPLFLENSVASYDNENRIVYFTDSGQGGAHNADIRFSYDRNGNIRHLDSHYLDVATGASRERDDWYTYDTMNRITIAKGDLLSGAIIQGAHGTLVSYDAAGERTGAVTTDASGTETEAYTYYDDGTLKEVSIGGVVRVHNSRDAMGRVTEYMEYQANGALAFHRYGSNAGKIEYNLDSTVAHDITDTVMSNGTVHSDNTYIYWAYQIDDTSGAISLVNGQNTWNGGVVGLVQNTVTPVSGSSYQTQTATSYQWNDAPVQKTIKYTNSQSQTPTYSRFQYDGLVNLNYVHVDDGRARDVKYLQNGYGEIVSRLELGAPGETGNPTEYYYYLNGHQLGDIGNNGASQTDYAMAINQRQALTSNTSNWANANGSNVGSAQGFEDFDGNYQPISASDPGPTSERYAVQDGDTLQSIAARLRGDASLWYLLADANGLNGTETLLSGQSLIVPNKVTNFHHNVSTFDVYDPSQKLGNLQPDVVPPPPPVAAPHHGGCGIIGKILVAIVAVVVTVITAGAAVAALAPGITTIGAGITAIGLGTTGLGFGTLVGIGAVAGAAGSIVSQGIGIAIGVQDSFSWKGVALAAIAGGVGAGVSASPLGNIHGFVGGAIRGAVSSAISQGIGVATGLQPRFDWAGVAVSAVQGGVEAKVSGWLPKGEAFSTAGIENSLVSGLAGGLGGAATRSVLTGTDFGDNILADLPSLIGNTIGNAIVAGVQDHELTKRAEALAQSNGLLADTKDHQATLAVAKNLQANIDGGRISRDDANVILSEPAYAMGLKTSDEAYSGGISVEKAAHRAGTTVTDYFNEYDAWAAKKAADPTFAESEPLIVEALPRDGTPSGSKIMEKVFTGGAQMTVGLANLYDKNQFLADVAFESAKILLTGGPIKTVAIDVVKHAGGAAFSNLVNAGSGFVEDKVSDFVTSRASGWDEHVELDGTDYDAGPPELGRASGIVAGTLVVALVTVGVGAIALRGKSILNIFRKDAAKSSEKGSIYRVPGEATPTGRPYIGRHNQPEPQKTRSSRDGRDRSRAEVIDTYDATDTQAGRVKEQSQIDSHGGVDALDNLRNEIAKPKPKKGR